MKFWRLATTCIFSLLSFNSSAALLERQDGQAYYDDVLNITWLGDANFGATENFGVAGITSGTYLVGSNNGVVLTEIGGGMSHDVAQNWIVAMNASNNGGGYLEVDTWRLPTASPVNGIEYNYNFFSKNGSYDTGYNISASGTIYAGSTASELAHLFYNTLGNEALYDINSNPTDCVIDITSGLSCLTNSGPFQNLYDHANVYWTDVETSTDEALGFTMQTGQQWEEVRVYTGRAWAVADGDVFVSTVPVPAAIWLFGSGLIGLVGIARRKKL